MEAKIIPFRHPGQERRRLSVFLAVLVALALVLAFFVIDGGQNWDRAGRCFSRLLWTPLHRRWGSWTASW